MGRATPGWRGPGMAVSGSDSGRVLGPSRGSPPLRRPLGEPSVCAGALPAVRLVWRLAARTESPGDSPLNNTSWFHPGSSSQPAPGRSNLLLPPIHLPGEVQFISKEEILRSDALTTHNLLERSAAANESDGSLMETCGKAISKLLCWV
ncbi:unnamed protein product [Pleuronectes platessa]|uniref:Uncharacterized protein n=1 Tax=Pleuronectes platessa TaxID=8262 RepID=A0A9N7Y2M2_PLEPL|nr:unnamed protein product [Pleuronectes platessa]